MRMNVVLALASASIVSAERNNGSVIFDSPAASPQAPVAEDNGFPGRIGTFELYGCVKSEDNWRSFRRASSLPEMDLNFCAASCEGKYFGVSNNDCFCADELDESKSTRVALERCNTDCPNDALQRCGGLESPNRRDISSSVLMTTYVRADKEDKYHKEPEYHHKKPEYHHKKPEHHGEPDWHSKKIVCYGDYCVAENECESCSRQRVVCRDGHCYTEKCESKDHNRLVICHGDKCDYSHCKDNECNHKVVCFDGNCGIEECFEDHCRKNLVCEGEHCRYNKCEGDKCHKKVICKGDECNDEEVCHGPECPRPAPPGPAPGPKPPAPGPKPPAPGPVCPPECHGEECPPECPPSGPVCPGPECPPVAPVCPGPDCPAGGKNGTIPPPVVGAAGSTIPAAGAAFGIAIGLAALL